MNPPKSCQLPECSAPPLARGWCAPHYQRWRRRGDPRAGVGFPPGVSLANQIALRTDRSGGPDACWPWLGPRKESGYGRIRHRGRKVYVSHLVYELEYGSLPEGMCVLHTCDNPPCVNPKHLWAGTKADNNRDRMQKGRGGNLAGENNGRAQLTEDQVRKIRHRYSLGGVSQRRLAEEHGLTPPAIGYIVRREHWSHVA